MKVTYRNKSQVLIHNATDLKVAIEELELKKAEQEKQIFSSLGEIKESLKPGNLAKSAFNKIMEKQTPLKLGLKIGGAIATGILAKRALSNNDDKNKKAKEVKSDSTPFLSKLALSVASSFFISKIPMVNAYASAAANQLFKKDKEDAVE